MIETVQSVRRPLEPPLQGLCEGIHQPSMESLFSATEDGCGICTKLVQQINQKIPNWHQEIDPATAMRFRADDGFGLWFSPEQWPKDGPILCLRGYHHEPSRAFEADLIHKVDALQNKSAYNSLILARKWLETYLQNHPSCAISRKSDFIAPRLLDLRNARVRLVDDIQTMNNCSYVALSHCWGANQNECKLTVGNYSQFCADIPEYSLPQTFRDAVSISRELGFQWLWIDFLCIIQSSPDDIEDQHLNDWRRHITIMNHVYQNCVVNITAADGDNPTSGCIDEDGDKEIELPCVRMLPEWTYRKDGRLTRGPSMNLSVIDEINALDKRYDGFIKLHLHSRGWVVQERLLSPRTIHFTKSQTFWECSKVPLACQDFPLSMNVHPPALNRKGGSRGHSPYRWKSADPTGQHNRWLDILEDYTRRSLTRPEDRLPAISGIASRAISVIQDTYRAGHFKSKLLNSLLWQCTLVEDIESNEFRGPSWSWVSMKAGVNWDRRMTIAFRNSFESDQMIMNADKRGKSPPKPKAMTPSASIIEMQVELVDSSNEFGQVGKGFVTLNGPLTEIIWSIQVRATRQDPQRMSPYIITVEFNNLKSRILSCAFDPIQLRDGWSVIKLLVLWHDDERMIESGLIMVEGSAGNGNNLETPEHFVRIGVFKSCDNDTTFDQWSNPLFSGYTHREVTIY